MSFRISSRILLFCALLGIALRLPAAEAPSYFQNLPQVGDASLRCISPDILELSLISIKPPDPARSSQWNFADAEAHSLPPSIKQFVVNVAGTNRAVVALGFKRRVAYMPLKERDLRVANFLYLKLASPIEPGQHVEVKNPSAALSPATMSFAADFLPLRLSPAIHVNQTGYAPDLPKLAMVGYFLGSLGELELSASNAPIPFQLIDAHSARSVFDGTLTLRPDHGFAFPTYQRVLQADFSAFKTPGEYRLSVPGLGASFPFFVDEGTPAAFARTDALGLYHQRCGTSNSLPFTRFTHDACHTAPAAVPVPESAFKFTWETIADKSADFAGNPRHTAPQLKSESSQLFLFVNHGQVNVSGGHHDAGDYSKYTINSAALIHHLVFAVDAFPGVSALDNLGLPESGDGKSDLLQEAKWEADFLAKMQDDDGGFYFLVYPREREYEQEVLPDHGDPQVVWPKTTAATAAAVAALAQCASSPHFKEQFPDASALYLKKARAGWQFLERAIAAHGQDGAYQKITHYGNEFMHDDELAWAACELYLATGEPAFRDKLAAWLTPATETRKWGWWRLYESYGCAIRSYAFAARSGRLKREQLDPTLLTWCENELTAAAQDQLHRSDDCAYGSSLPEETKQSRSVGWYFSGDTAFDLAVAYQLDYPSLNDPRPRFLAAIVANLNYEAGCNPVNVCYLTGLGWNRPHEIVHQYAQNDRRILPPTGIPIGNISDGFTWLDKYQKEPGQLSFPSDGDDTAPYPFYDRWGDTFNLSTEFVIVNQARSLACNAWLMARTPLKDQPWKSAPGRIVGVPAQSPVGNTVAVTLEAPGLNLKNARIIWEARDQQPACGPTFHFKPVNRGDQWLEVEAQLPDGRRIFATTNFPTGPFRPGT